jgi:hypothetical protein
VIRQANASGTSTRPTGVRRNGLVICDKLLSLFSPQPVWRPRLPIFVKDSG